MYECQDGVSEMRVVMKGEKNNFYEMIEGGSKRHKFEKKMAMLNDTFNVLAASNSFLSYFESNGKRLFALTDFIHPEDLEGFKSFVTDTANIGSTRICRMLNSDGEYRIDIVKLMCRKLDSHHMYTFDIELIDIEETVYINENALSDISKLRRLMALSNEYFFTYDRKDNIFKMFHYTDYKREILYRMDVDEWKELMISKGYIAQDEYAVFESFVSDMKSYANAFMVKLNCAVRTQNEQMESLKFTGTLYGANEDDKVVIGRIMTNAASLGSISLDMIDELQFDSLTGVYNKKVITEYAKKLISERRNEVITLVILDLDRFKNVNDTYGHLYGDKVLSRAAQRLKAAVGDDGFVGRIGGDEFMIILTDINGDQMLRSMLRAIRSQIKWEFADEFKDMEITCSIGAAMCPNNGEDYEELFKKADYCLYIAKEKGRDRYVFFRDDMHRQSYELSLDKKKCIPRDNDREIKALKYVSEFFAKAHTDEKCAIKDMLNYIKTSFLVDNITIYYGEDLKNVYSMGDELLAAQDAAYVHTDEYKALMGDNLYVKAEFIGKLIGSFPVFCEHMKNSRIFSTLQCVIGTGEDIQGLITFNRCKESAQWAEYEIATATILASYLTMIAKK